jgi:hypothetical protein
MNIVTQMLHREDKTMKAADVVTEMLYSVGVRRIYGVVGDSLNGITESLRRRGDIDWIHTRHEEAAAFAAGAEAHLTGDLAVCAGSCGPGNLHLINGLFDCHRSRVPVLAIAAQIPSAEIGRGYFQETHPNWFPIPNSFPPCWNRRSGPQSVTAAWLSSSSQETWHCSLCLRRSRLAPRSRSVSRSSYRRAASWMRWPSFSMIASGPRCCADEGARARTSYC